MFSQGLIEAKASDVLTTVGFVMLRRADEIIRAMVPSGLCAFLVCGCITSEGAIGKVPSAVTNQSTSSEQNVQGSDSTAVSAGISLNLLSDSASITRLEIGKVATLSAKLVDIKGEPVPNELVTFSGAESISALSPAIGTAMTNSNGTATVSLRATEEGAGTVSVSAMLSGTAVKSTLNFEVISAQTQDLSAAGVASISFVEASPKTLRIKGSPSDQGASSAVTFSVKDSLGKPLPEAQVKFSLSATAGGVSIFPLTTKSSTDGLVTTNISAGSFPTPVEIKATVVNPTTGKELFAFSNGLSVSSGQPSQDFFSISADKLNIDGCEQDGSSTLITARLGDQFGNPVPDGTVVNFVAEGGVISGTFGLGACQTQEGKCSATLTSQAYRPKPYVPLAGENPTRLPMSSDMCRVTVLAYAIGQESFRDLNSNGVFDANEPYSELLDPFLDTEPPALGSRATFDPTHGDRLVAFDSSHVVPQGDGKWGETYVQRSLEIVFSSRLGTKIAAPASFDFACASASTLANSTQSGKITISDTYTNPLAMGSSVTSEGIGASAVLSLNQIPSTLLPTSLDIIVTGDPAQCAADAAKHGLIVLSVTPVGGVMSKLLIPISYS